MVAIQEELDAADQIARAHFNAASRGMAALCGVKLEEDPWTQVAPHNRIIVYQTVAATLAELGRQLDDGTLTHAPLLTRIDKLVKTLRDRSLENHPTFGPAIAAKPAGVDHGA